MCFTVYLGLFVNVALTIMTRFWKGVCSYTRGVEVITVREKGKLEIVKALVFASETSPEYFRTYSKSL